MQINVAIIFGGISVEHDISILSAMQVINAIDQNKFKIFPIYIDRNGKWKYSSNFTQISALSSSKYTEVIVKPNDDNLYGIKRKSIKPLCKLSCCVPITHGTNVEDGTLQGILQSSGIPYTSSNVLSSAITMDKEVMKMIFSYLGYPITKHHTIKKSQWLNSKDEALAQCDNIGFPLFVKPCSLGSSIGISYTERQEQLEPAINLAFMLDEKVIIEQAVKNATELNCSAFQNRDKLMISAIEKPIKTHNFLNFENKYVSKSKTKSHINSQGMANLVRELPANISKKLKSKVEDMTKNAYVDFGCKGIVRVDYLLDEDSNLYINEINSIPGSLAFYLWNEQDIKFPELIDSLIYSAIIDKAKEQKIIRTFESHLV